MDDTDTREVIEISDDSDDDEVSRALDVMERNLTTTMYLRRKIRDRNKKKIGQLRESKERYELDSKHELRQLKERLGASKRRCTKSEHEATGLRHDVAASMKETALLKRRLAASKDDLAEFRRRIGELQSKLKAQKDERKRMRHLICDICRVKVKGRVTKCGHGFCRDCLDTYFESLKKKECPACRQEIDKEEDVWPLYSDAN